MITGLKKLNDGAIFISSPPMNLIQGKIENQFFTAKSISFLFYNAKDLKLIN